MMGGLKRESRKKGWKTEPRIGVPSPNMGKVYKHRIERGKAD